jgi:hypothetical protein
MSGPLVILLYEKDGARYYSTRGGKWIVSEDNHGWRSNEEEWKPYLVRETTDHQEQIDWMFRK